MLRSTYAAPELCSHPQRWLYVSLCIHTVRSQHFQQTKPEVCDGFRFSLGQALGNHFSTGREGVKVNHQVLSWTWRRWFSLHPMKSCWLLVQDKGRHLDANDKCTVKSLDTTQKRHMQFWPQQTQLQILGWSADPWPGLPESMILILSWHISSESCRDGAEVTCSDSCMRWWKCDYNVNVKSQFCCVCAVLWCVEGIEMKSPLSEDRALSDVEAAKSATAVQINDGANKPSSVAEDRSVQLVVSCYCQTHVSLSQTCRREIRKMEFDT